MVDTVGGDAGALDTAAGVIAVVVGVCLAGDIAVVVGVCFAGDIVFVVGVCLAGDIVVVVGVCFAGDIVVVVGVCFAGDIVFVVGVCLQSCIGQESSSNSKFEPNGSNLNLKSHGTLNHLNQFEPFELMQVQI